MLSTAQKNKKMFTSKPSSTENSFDPNRNTSKGTIHTMKMDLTGVTSQALPERPTSVIEDNINQKSSPFFNNLPEQPVAAAPIEKAAPVFSAPVSHTPIVRSEGMPVSINPTNSFPGQRSINQKETLRFTTDSEKTTTAWKKIITTAFLLSLFLAIGFGGYYIWSNQLIDFSQIPLPSFLSKNELSEKPLPLSAKTPNYFNIDIEKADKNELKKLVEKYSQEMIASNVTSPVEFRVSDLNNNPVTFATFSQKMGLSLSPQVVTALDKDFSLFIYNDIGKVRLGLALATSDGEKLRALLIQEEPQLPTELQNIFLAQYSITQGAFKTSAYKGIATRYINMTSSEELSIDYTLSSNQLIIGTSKMTLRSIIDYMNTQ